ncbi:MAG: ATP-binding protein [Verrucomicrobia bacterium]|nr:ATP-binding protein [Verrucomicrobiota bacterium]
MNTDEPIRRLLTCPDRSFFLFGPRGTGKSTWLKQVLPDALRLDLLDASLDLELSGHPHRLEALVGSRSAGSWVVLDEIQKVPALLNEVHRLMECRRWRFALCGSSARKLRRGGANLLAGRALTLNMEGFSAAELDEAFDARFSLEWGTLPFVQLDRKHAPDILSAYVNTYLKEEIRQEGLVRNVPPFVRFLHVAGQMNGQAVNGHNIAREAAVPRTTVDVYFTILTDTLLGHFLPAWRPGFKVREVAHPKFFWFDPGVARAAAGLLRDPADRLWQGTALETLIYHELRVFNEVSRKLRSITYYRTGAGVEVDFIIETRKRQSGKLPHVVAIEVKLAEKWDRSWEKPMRDMAAAASAKVERMFGVYMGPRAYHFDGIEVLPVLDFLRALHRGEVF